MPRPRTRAAPGMHIARATILLVSRVRFWWVCGAVGVWLVGREWARWMRVKRSGRNEVGENIVCGVGSDVEG